LYPDEKLGGPVPLTSGVLAPGDPVEFVRVHCLIRGPQEKASVRCTAAGRRDSPPVAKSWHERLEACTDKRERKPRRRELKAVQASWQDIVNGQDFKTKGMSWSVARYNPPVPSSGKTLVEVAITHEWRGPERVGRGCENPPPDVGCDPYVVETGRMITMKRHAVRYGYSGAPGIELRQLFGGRAPLLHRLRIGEANAQGNVQDHPILKIAGSKNGIEDYRRRQLAALDALMAAGDHSPNVQAAILINKAIAALHLKDLDLLRSEVAELRELVTRAKVDRKALELDNTLAHFDRVLAGEWLLEDPCPR
jgi:hypothetical protein